MSNNLILELRRTINMVDKAIEVLEVDAASRINPSDSPFQAANLVDKHGNQKLIPLLATRATCLSALATLEAARTKR